MRHDTSGKAERAGNPPRADGVAPNVNRSRSLIVAWVGACTALGVGIVAVSHRADTKPPLGSCQTERGVLAGRKCSPTAAQVALATGVPIPSTATAFRASYEQFQDWHLVASFLVPRAELVRYTALAAYPGVRLDGPAVQVDGATPGERHLLSIHSTARSNGGSSGPLISVKVSAFTS